MKARYITLLSLVLLLLSAPAARADLRRVMRGGRYGYEDERGRMVIPARYAVAMDFSEGLAYVSDQNDPAREWKHGFIDERGRMVVVLSPGDFHPARPYDAGSETVVFNQGFVELPTGRSDGRQAMQEPFVIVNRGRLLIAAGRDPKHPETITPQSGIFLDRVLSGRGALLGVLAHDFHSTTPAGIVAFDTINHQPLTSAAPGEMNNWFDGFGVIRYTGGTYRVYTPGRADVNYDDVRVYERTDTQAYIYVARRLNKPYRRYSAEGTLLDSLGYDSPEQATAADTVLRAVNLDSWLRNSRSMREIISRRSPRFEGLDAVRAYYLRNDSTLDSLRLPAFRPLPARFVAVNADTVVGPIRSSAAPQSFDPRRDRISNIRFRRNTIYIYNRRNQSCAADEFEYQSMDERLVLDGNRVTTRPTQLQTAFGVAPDTFAVQITHRKSGTRFRLLLAVRYRDSLDLRGETGAVILSRIPGRDSVAMVLNAISRTATVVRLPLAINGRGLDGQDGEAGSDGPAGTPKYNYKDSNGATQTIPGTCAEPGGNGGNGEPGTDGASLLVVLASGSEHLAGLVTVDTSAGRGGRGGRAGLGGLHGVGGPCSGRAANGVAGADGADGRDGESLIVTLK